jgi:hypothetical protein
MTASRENVSQLLVAGEEFVGSLLLQVRPVVVASSGHAIACGVLDLMLDDIASDVAALDVPRSSRGLSRFVPRQWARGG